MATTTSSPVDRQKYQEELLDYFDALAAQASLAAIPLNEYRGQIETILSRTKSSSLISNAGLLNGGKSTLFNALIDKDEHFATAAARCTRARQFASLNELELVDTPGLDAELSDTTEAQEVYRQSQVILFVHSAMAGELDAQELESLNVLKELYPNSEYRQKAIIPVLTKVQNIGDELPQVVKIIRAQWKDVMGAEPHKLFTVRAKTYLKGLREDKPRLQEYSEIPKLRAHLHDLEAELRLHHDSLRQERVNNILKKLDQDLGALIKQKQNERDKKQRLIDQQISHMNKDIAQFKARHLSSYRRL